MAELTGTGRALELGIGTGRIAIPLTEGGVAVKGVDASEAMVARLLRRHFPADDRARYVAASRPRHPSGHAGAID